MQMKESGGDDGACACACACAALWLWVYLHPFRPPLLYRGLFHDACLCELVPLPFSIPVPVTISPMSIPVPLGVAAASTTAITTRSGFSDEQLRIKCCQILKTVKHTQ